MSNDLLLLSLDQNAQSLALLHQHSPLFAAMVNLEDLCPEPRDALSRALPEFIRATIGEVGTVRLSPFHTGGGCHTYGLSVFANGAVSGTQREAAYQAFVPLSHRMSRLIYELPGRLRERLGIHDTSSAPVDDWVWILFHLAWHFPDHFARGVVRRVRLLQTDYGLHSTPEDWIQLGGLSGNPGDLYPGLIFSRFPCELDLVTATGHAIELLRRAVRGGGAFQATDANRDLLRNLHQEFIAIGDLASQRGHSDADGLEGRVLRLDNSFQTQPAAQWAGYQGGGATQQTLHLSLLRGIKEVCVLRGSWVNDFIRLADKAGSFLPAWPGRRGAALLDDVTSWLMRVNRRRELESQQYCFATEDGSPPAGTPIPRAQVAEYFWSSTRSSSDFGGLVTDHRGCVERWLGFVFHSLKEFEPDSVEIRNVPEGQTNFAVGQNAMLTLRGLNLYQASARAMELAGWVWQRAQGGHRALGSSHDPTAEAEQIEPLHFDDPWVTDLYPPPDAGRYIRFHRGEEEAEELRWRAGWSWTERPEDGWIECGTCGPATGCVLVGQGQPPAICDWLPAEWPADFFPLGRSAEHCVGWRELVRSILSYGQDTILPDDREYGWLTLTRATRQLAHHLGVISMDRLIAPFPASRAEARREIEPLLDGLVLSRKQSGKSTGPIKLSAGESGRLATAMNLLAQLAPELFTPARSARIRCDESDRTIYLDGKCIARELELTLFRFFRAIAEAYPNPIQFKAIQSCVPGLHGKHPTRDLKDRLPDALTRLVTSGKHGYGLSLPNPKQTTTVHTS